MEIAFRLSDTMVTNIFDQISVKELIRDVGEEKSMRLLKQVIENNLMILKLQKQVLKLQEAEKQKKRRDQDMEQLRRDHNER